FSALHPVPHLLARSAAARTESCATVRPVTPTANRSACSVGVSSASILAHSRWSPACEIAASAEATRLPPLTSLRMSWSSAAFGGLSASDRLRQSWMTGAAGETGGVQPVWAVGQADFGSWIVHQHSHHVGVAGLSGPGQRCVPVAIDEVHLHPGTRQQQGD